LVDLNDPLNFLEECHRLGAGGMQVPLGVRDQTYLPRQQNLWANWAGSGSFPNV
jgi:hypothetical protein